MTSRCRRIQTERPRIDFGPDFSCGYKTTQPSHLDIIYQVIQNIIYQVLQNVQTTGVIAQRNFKEFVELWVHAELAVSITSAGGLAAFG